MSSLDCGAMKAKELMLKVVTVPRPGAETRRRKKKNARELTSSSSPRYPSMPRYPPSPSRGEIDVSEIRKATFKVRVGDTCTKDMEWLRDISSLRCFQGRYRD